MSVVIPTFQMRRYVTEALESLRSSTYTRWHCLVVDDGSTDGTPDLVRSMAQHDRRIELLCKENGGPHSCLNAAAPHVRGDVVCLLDADDLVLPERLSAVVEALRANPRAGFVVHRLAVCDKDLRVIGISPSGSELPSGDFSEAVLRSRHGLSGLGVSSGFGFRAEAFRVLFPNGVDVRRFPDEYVRRAIPLVTEIHGLDRVLGIRRIHGANVTANAHADLLPILTAAKHDYQHIGAALTDIATRFGYADAIAPEAEDVDLLQMSWIISRLRQDGDTAAHWRRFTGAPGYASLPLLHRTYMRLVHDLPLPLFRALMATVLRSDGSRLLLNYLAMLRRPHVRAALPGRVSFLSMVRLAAVRQTAG